MPSLLWQQRVIIPLPNPKPGETGADLERVGFEVEIHVCMVHNKFAHVSKPAVGGIKYISVLVHMALC